MFYRLAVKINCEAIALITNATLVLIGIENDTQHTGEAHPPQTQVSKTIPGSREYNEYREFNEIRENSISLNSLNSLISLKKAKSQWLMAKSLKRKYEKLSSLVFRLSSIF